VTQLVQVEIPAPYGFLEGLLRRPDASASTDETPSVAAPPSMAALICHPPPEGGGTMHNKVLLRTR